MQFVVFSDHRSPVCQYCAYRQACEILDLNCHLSSSDVGHFHSHFLKQQGFMPQLLCKYLGVVSIKNACCYLYLIFGAAEPFVITESRHATAASQTYQLAKRHLRGRNCLRLGSCTEITNAKHGLPMVIRAFTQVYLPIYAALSCMNWPIPLVWEAVGICHPFLHGTAKHLLPNGLMKDLTLNLQDCCCCLASSNEIIIKLRYCYWSEGRQCSSDFFVFCERCGRFSPTI